jgi:hypothetical protein
MMQLTLGAFVLWNYIVYRRVQYAMKSNHELTSYVDTSYAFDV